MKPLFSQWQPLVQARIIQVLDSFRDEAARYNLDEAQIEYLKKLAVKGKQFRGCLLLDFYQNLSDSFEIERVLDIAVAIELYGTALLVHDDIMDRAESRRSLPTAHTFLATHAKNNDLKEPDHFGSGAALCLGDVLFFIATELIAEAPLPPEQRLKISIVSSRELALLGLAQVEDLRLSSFQESVTKEEIITMYRGKTGRYTGRWPLEIASILAGFPADICQKVAKVGEDIGLLYQLKDDELGLFGVPAETGKSTTSDITEGKKTLYYWNLQQLLTEEEKRRVFSIIGNSVASEQDVEFIKAVIEEKGISEIVQKEMADLKLEIERVIDTLALSEKGRLFLIEILYFVISRKK